MVKQVVKKHFVHPNVQFVVPVCCLCCEYRIATGECKVRTTRKAYGRKPYFWWFEL